jgi:hypothetical protein
MKAMDMPWGRALGRLKKTVRLLNISGRYGKCEFLGSVAAFFENSL